MYFFPYFLLSQSHGQNRIDLQAQERMAHYSNAMDSSFSFTPIASQSVTPYILMVSLLCLGVKVFKIVRLNGF